jgi:hypothetical protein
MGYKLWVISYGFQVKGRVTIKVRILRVDPLTII